MQRSLITDQVHTFTWPQACSGDHDRFVRNPNSLCTSVSWRDDEDRITWTYTMQVTFISQPPRAPAASGSGPKLGDLFICYGPVLGHGQGTCTGLLHSWYPAGRQACTSHPSAALAEADARCPDLNLRTRLGLGTTKTQTPPSAQCWTSLYARTRHACAWSRVTCGRWTLRSWMTRA